MNRRTFYMFMSPSLLVMLLLMVFPLLTSIWLSMQFMTFRNINSPEFVLFANYLDVFDDRKFWQAFSFTMTFIALAVPMQILVGFLIAVLLDQVSVRIRGIYIAAFLMPFIVVPVVGTLMVKQLVRIGRHRGLGFSRADRVALHIYRTVRQGAYSGTLAVGGNPIPHDCVFRRLADPAA